MAFTLLNSCKAQLVSFLASCLGTPEIFENNSLNSINDFISVISDDATPIVQTLLREVMDEMDHQGFIKEVHLRRNKPDFQTLIISFLLFRLFKL
jgi:hypothetical protein